MATASDANGWLPMWVQKLGIPGAIVKDVGYFMKWILDERRHMGKDMHPASRDGGCGPC